MIERSRVAFWGIVVSVPVLLIFGFGLGYTRPGVAIRGDGFGVMFVVFAAEVLLAFRWVTNGDRFGGGDERKFARMLRDESETRGAVGSLRDAVERRMRDM
jgi:hypothetical protein